MIFLYFILCAFSTFGLNQLAFSGGGAFGAVEIGILKKLQSINNNKFDIYTGISAGGINAGYLSHYKDLDEGIKTLEIFYDTIKNDMIWSILPLSNISLFNTDPMRETFTNILVKLPDSLIETYIGATNLYSGKLDVYRYDQLESDNEQIDLLMSTSAIPVIFPPIKFKGFQYADGGILQNELIDIVHDGTYINITFITPSNDSIYDNTEITSLKEMILRTSKIVTKNFDNAISKINTNCEKIIGEINKYYVDPALLSNYNILNFNHGIELIKIGLENMQHEKSFIC
jgi:predicted acylesterase/phospholipase RssA